MGLLNRSSLVHVALATTILASPLQSASSGQTATSLLAKQKEQVALFRQYNVCAGQSCFVADASGSTGRPLKLKPEGGDDQDIKCIAHYNPAISAALATQDFPTVEKQPTGFHSALMSGLDSLWRPVVNYWGATDKGTFNGKCTPNIVIFARGTFEPGELGAFVGPPLIKALEKDDFSQWSLVGVPYDANVPGDYCLGLPGGMVARDMINQAAKKCPTSQLFLSGYSQGAMVARNGIAYADPAAKTHIKGLLTYGDPFQGAPIKDWTGPVATFCASDDGVCGGNFELALSHLAYGFGADLDKGAAALETMANGTYVAPPAGKEVAPESVAAKPKAVAVPVLADPAAPAIVGQAAPPTIPAALPAPVASPASAPVQDLPAAPAAPAAAEYTMPVVQQAPAVAAQAAGAYTMPAAPAPPQYTMPVGGPAECEKCSK